MRARAQQGGTYAHITHTQHTHMQPPQVHQWLLRWLGRLWYVLSCADIRWGGWVVAMFVILTHKATKNDTHTHTTYTHSRNNTVPPPLASQCVRCPEYNAYGASCACTSCNAGWQVASTVCSGNRMSLQTGMV